MGFPVCKQVDVVALGFAHQWWGIGSALLDHTGLLPLCQVFARWTRCCGGLAGGKRPPLTALAHFRHQPLALAAEALCPPTQEDAALAPLAAPLCQRRGRQAAHLYGRGSHGIPFRLRPFAAKSMPACNASLRTRTQHPSREGALRLGVPRARQASREAVLLEADTGQALRRHRGMFTEMPCPRTAVLSQIEYKSVRISSRGSLYVSHYESRAPHWAAQRAKVHTGQDLSSPHGYTLPNGLLLGRDPWHRFCCCISAQDGRDNAVAFSHVAPSLHALGGATPRTALAQDRGPHGWNPYSKELNHGEHD